MFVQQMLASIPQGIFNFLVYMAIAITMVIGLFSCIAPLRRIAYSLKRAQSSLEMMVIKGQSSEAWKSEDFLGHNLRRAWKKFLINLSSANERGLNVNVGDFINDESVFKGVNLQLGDMLPSLLTSFGILGTFIGLMRGVSSLDITNAGATMDSISKMLGGMSFAYGTSIAGLVCSIIFSILNRSSQNSATGALDDFNQSFHDLVLPEVADFDVRFLCYREEHSGELRSGVRHIVSSIQNQSKQIANELIKPVTNEMQSFLSQASREQVEGVNKIVMSFVSQMDRVLGGQLLGLGQSINAILDKQNNSQANFLEAQRQLERLMGSMQGVNNGTSKLIELFDGYVARLNLAQNESKHFQDETARLYEGLNQVLKKQTASMSLIEEGQRRLIAQMKQSEENANDMLSKAKEGTREARLETEEIARELSNAGKRIVDGVNYARRISDEALEKDAKIMQKSFESSIDEMQKSLKSAIEELSCEIKGLKKP